MCVSETPEKQTQRVPLSFQGTHTQGTGMNSQGTCCQGCPIPSWLHMSALINFKAYLSQEETREDKNTMVVFVLSQTQPTNGPEFNRQWFCINPKVIEPKAFLEVLGWSTQSLNCWEKTQVFMCPFRNPNTSVGTKTLNSRFVEAHPQVMKTWVLCWVENLNPGPNCGCVPQTDFSVVVLKITYIVFLTG